jgi:hypothetical protein
MHPYSDIHVYNATGAESELVQNMRTALVNACTIDALIEYMRAFDALEIQEFARDCLISKWVVHESHVVTLSGIRAEKALVRLAIVYSILEKEASIEHMIHAFEAASSLKSIVDDWKNLPKDVHYLNEYHIRTLIALCDANVNILVSKEIPDDDELNLSAKIQLLRYAFETLAIIRSETKKGDAYWAMCNARHDETYVDCLLFCIQLFKLKEDYGMARCVCQYALNEPSLKKEKAVFESKLRNVDDFINVLKIEVPKKKKFDWNVLPPPERFLTLK